MLVMSDGQKNILTDIKVLDLSTLLPGPYATLMLADLGAEVTKVEHPRRGDPMRYMLASDKQDSLIFQLLNRDKKSITVNYKRKEGVKLIKKLLEKSDILVHNFRKDSVEKMGLDYKALAAEFPKLIYCSISGYGYESSRAAMAGHDANFAALGGLLSLSGTQVNRQKSKLHLPNLQIADILGGSFPALTAILAALYQREKNGGGSFVDIAIAEGSLASMILSLGYFLTEQKSPEAENWIFSGMLPNYRIYTTADGREVVLASLEEVLFQSFLRRMQRSDLIVFDLKKEEDRAFLHRELEKLFASKDFSWWQKYFGDPEICLSPVNGLKEMLEENFFLERGAVFKAANQRGDIIPYLSQPIPVSKPTGFTDSTIQGENQPRHSSFQVAPGLGMHTENILNDFGISKEELLALQEKKII